MVVKVVKVIYKISNKLSDIMHQQYTRGFHPGAREKSR